MCTRTYIVMTSKTISITEDVYNELIKIKARDESFSQLFLRMLKNYKQNIEDSFGSWNLSDEEKTEIWKDLSTHPGRRWNKQKLGVSK
ncbi:MAG: antitoxin VapB family protein [Candidatus Helarchaeota archaeon]